MPRCSLMSMGTPFFISKLKFSYDKYSVDKVWTKIYCHFYFRGITLTDTLSRRENFMLVMVHLPNCSIFKTKALVKASCLRQHILRLSVEYAQNVFQNLLSVIRNLGLQKSWYLKDKNLMPGTRKKGDRNRPFFTKDCQLLTANYEEKSGDSTQFEAKF